MVHNRSLSSNALMSQHYTLFFGFAQVVGCTFPYTVPEGGPEVPNMVLVFRGGFGGARFRMGSRRIWRRAWQAFLHILCCLIMLPYICRLIYCGLIMERVGLPFRPIKSLPGNPCPAAAGIWLWEASGTRMPLTRCHPAEADSGLRFSTQGPGWSP